MPRKFLKRWTPDAGKLRENAWLRFLGTLLNDPNLFHLNRHSVSVAFMAGLFVCVQPVPGQVMFGALAAIMLRCNLPLTVALTWIGNPVTLPFIWYMAYRWGAWMLGQEPLHAHIEFNVAWLKANLPLLWQPLILGSLVMGTFFGSLSYLVVQWLWRWQAAKKWKSRSTDRRQFKLRQEEAEKISRQDQTRESTDRKIGQPDKDSRENTRRQ